MKPDKRWLDEQKRKEQLRSAAAGGQTAYFGFQQVARSQKTDRVRQHFNSVARHYDFMNTLLSFGIHYLWKRIAVRSLSLNPGQQVLDVCGGTGDLAILAAEKVAPTGRVVVYDINRAMIQAGLPKADRKGLRGYIEYIQGNAESISAAGARFDAVMVGFGIRNVTDMPQGFAEMYRVLKPGGKLMCLEFSKPTFPVFRKMYDYYSFYIMPWLGELIVGSRQAYTHLPESIRMFPLPDELAVILRRIGFSRVAYRPLTNGIAVIHLAVK